MKEYLSLHTYPNRSAALIYYIAITKINQTLLVDLKSIFGKISWKPKCENVTANTKYKEILFSYSEKKENLKVES